jgi:hypothetical protein
MANQRAEQRHKTVRYLQRRIRYRMPGVSIPSLAVPHTKWGFLEASLVAKLTRERVSLFPRLVYEILRCLGETANDDQVKRAVLGVGRRQKALEVWGCVPCDSDSDDGSDSVVSQKMNGASSLYMFRSRSGISARRTSQPTDSSSRCFP